VFIVLSILFFILLAASAVFGFGWFFASFAWLFSILFWVFLIGLIVSLIMAVVNRGERQPPG
jgi:uncharacterized membrane protein YtjA (UPF0391 family)